LPGGEPLLVVALTIDVGNPPDPALPVVFVLGCVDSGADRTLLPLSTARRLGIKANQLTLDPGTSGGVGSTFNTWSSTVPIRGVVAAILDPAKGPEPWGPGFAMNPAFTNLQPEPSTLLGRADFFQAFSISFDEDAATPSFTISPREP
jgi:hypothetical protein